MFGKRIYLYCFSGRKEDIAIYSDVMSLLSSAIRFLTTEKTSVVKLRTIRSTYWCCADLFVQLAHQSFVDRKAVHHYLLNLLLNFCNVGLTSR